MLRPSFWLEHSRLSLFILFLTCLGLGWVFSLDPDWIYLPFDPTRPQHVAGLVVALAAVIVSLKTPRFVVILLLALIFTNASEVGVRYHHLPSVIQIVVILAVLSFLYQWLVTRGRSPVLDPVFLWIVLYAMVMFASTSVAVNLEQSEKILIVFVKNAALVFVIVNLLDTREALSQSMLTLILAAFFLGAVSVYQVATGSYGDELGGFGRIKYAHIVGRHFEQRIAGPLSDPNFYAQIMAAVVPFAVLRIRNVKNPLEKDFLFLAVFIIITAVLFTYSRAAAVALAMIAVLMLLYLRLRARVWGALVLAAVIAIAFVPSQLTGRLITLEQLFTGNDEDILKLDTSFEQRKLYMRTAWEMVKDAPVLGVGVGNYGDNYIEYSSILSSSVRSYKWFDQRRYAHSLYLEVAAETGVIGLLAFAAIIVATYLALFRAMYLFRRKGDQSSVDQAAAIALAITSYLLTSIFLHGDYSRYLWLLIGLALAARNIAQITSRERETGLGKAGVDVRT